MWRKYYGRKQKHSKIISCRDCAGNLSVSDPEQGPTEDGKSLAPGNATANSYLIIGEERAVLLDLAVNSPELKTYAEKLAGKPVQLVLSHGHYDHAFYLNQYQDVWMNTKDKFLLKKGCWDFHLWNHVRSSMGWKPAM